MADINIPGEELNQLGQLLGQVMDLMDRNASVTFDAAVVGHPLEASGSHFNSAWDDGRTQIKREGNALKEACDTIVKAFDDVDTKTADSLKGDGSANS